MFNRPRLVTNGALALFLAAGAATSALAADPSAKPSDGTPSAAAATAAADVTAAPAPAAADHPIAVRDDAAVQVIANADGSFTALLDDSFLSTSVARIDADGKVVIGCVHTRAEYDAFIAADALPDGAEVR